jgi:hypothetical protein
MDTTGTGKQNMADVILTDLRARGFQEFWERLEPYPSRALSTHSTS